MPRFNQYQPQVTRQQREDAFWDDPANVIGLARQAGQQVEQEQQHAMQYDLAQQENERRIAKQDWDMAQSQIKSDTESRKMFQAIGAYGALSELDPGAPDYRQKFAGIVRQYPLGMLDPKVTALRKEYDTAHSHSMDAVRKAVGGDETLDPRDYTIQKDDGTTDFDFDTMRQVAQQQAMKRTTELADVRAQQAQALQDRGFGTITADEKGVRGTMKPAGEDERKQHDQMFIAAEKRRTAALAAVQKGGYRTPAQKEAINRELEAATQEYGSAYEKRFGQPWQSTPNLTVPEDRGAGESASVRGDLNPPEAAPAATPTPSKPSEVKQLDKATAQAIFKEAGGDANKARQLAKERGYSF